MSDATRFRVLVTGAGGQLGGELMRAFWPDGVAVTGRGRDLLDITDPAAIEAELAQGRFDVAINAAAYTAVDRAETEIARAFAVNETGAANLARACAARGAALIHVSTDYVFDGAKATPYTEMDLVNPVSVYGRSKWAGEVAVRSTVDRHVILRTAWVYAAHGSNFVRTILRLSSERDELRVVADQRGNPTSAADLAGAIVRVVERLASDRGDGRPIQWGTYHCANAGEASWFDFARTIVELAAPYTGGAPKVTPIPATDYPTAARRPANSRLACDKLQANFGICLRPWRDAIADVVREIHQAERAEEPND